MAECDERLEWSGDVGVVGVGVDECENDVEPALLPLAVVAAAVLVDDETTEIL